MSDMINKADKNGGFSNRQPPPADVKQKPNEELGTSGVKITSGFVHDEFIQKLVDRKGRQTYRQMRDNDDVIGALFFMIENIVKNVEWRVEYDEGDTQGGSDATPDDADYLGYRDIADHDSAVAFLEGVLFDDMVHTWEDFLTNLTTGYVFGWQWTEIVWKKRNGKNRDSDLESIFVDGLYGISKLADRSQETLWKWDEEDGRVYGMWQEPPNGGAVCYIPAWKSIHFKTAPNKDNPEGRSILRNAYRPWFFKCQIQEQEAIAIERELNGLPVVKAPSSQIHGTSAEAKKAADGYESLVRDIKFNEQGGVVIPSDPYYDADGNPTSIPQVELTLLTSGGNRAIDTNQVINRYDHAIARTILAQFLLLGTASAKGGFSQSKNESDIFFDAIDGMVKNMATTINRQLVPKIWEMNGLDTSLMPYVVPGKSSPENIALMADYVQKLSASGLTFFDNETVKHLRGIAGLPETDIESDSEPVVSFAESQE